MRKTKVYLSLTPAERRLAIVAMVWFRNKVVRQGLDPMDVNRVLGKLVR